MGLVGKLAWKAAKKTGKTIAATASGAFQEGASGAGRGFAVEALGGRGSALGQIIEAGHQARLTKRYSPSDLQRQVALVLLGDAASETAIARIGEPVVRDINGIILDARDGSYEVVEVAMLGFIPSDPERIKIEERAQRVFGLTVTYEEGGLIRLSPISHEQLVNAEVARSSEGVVLAAEPVRGSKNSGSRLLTGISNSIARDLPKLTALIARDYPGELIYGMTAREDGGWNIETGPASSRPAVYDAERYRIDPSAKPEFVDAYAIERGRRLIEFDAVRRSALVARLDPTTERLRDRLAEMLRTAPHEVELRLVYRPVEGREAAVLDAIDISRYPATKLPKEAHSRAALWEEFRSLVPGATDRHRIADNYLDGAVSMLWADDRTVEMKTLSDFDAEFPNSNTDASTSHASFPVAWSDDGRPVPYNLFHTLIVGKSGAGKGSVLWSIAHGLIPAAREGLVEFYGIDPKSAEFPMAAGLFKEIATTPDQWLELLKKLAADLAARQAARYGKARETKVSRETPLRMIFIDEFATVKAYDTDPKRKKEVSDLLQIILTQGRSEATYIVAAVQDPQKEIIGQLRNGFGMMVALRLADATEAGMVLGAGAVEQGAAPHLIAPANKGNGYRTSGVAYIALEEANDDATVRPVKVRFPYTSDEQLAEWSREFSSGQVVKVERTAEGRVILPAPDASVFGAWDNQFISRAYESATTVEQPDDDLAVLPTPAPADAISDLNNLMKGTETP